MSNNRQRALTVLLILMSIIGAALIFSAKKAKAHDWYENDCCNGRDCNPVAAEAMEEVGPDIWRYKVTGNIFQNEKGVKRIRPSRDGEFHVCIGTYSFNKGKSLCLYIPVSS